ncbi:MAG: CinA family protein [Clostridia bacterium]|nr:CinA family protein [Clostridia bacterium]
MYEVGPRKMPEVVKDLLADKQWKLSLAESCTAGLAAAAIVDLPGASAVLTGGVVAYENRIKQTVLGVSEEILVRDGAVSEACALAMARGCRDIMKTEIAAAVTGIAGPDGGSPDKPVGTVWLAVVSDQGEQTRKLQLGGGRERIRRVSVLNVFNLIRQHLLT